MSSKKIEEYISRAYSRWKDYASFQASQAGINDQGGDILNEVLLALLQKPTEQIEALLAKKKGKYTQLDFFVLRMIKLNAHSPTSPYRHKTRNVPIDLNIDPLLIEKEDIPTEESENDIVILENCRKAREVLDSLPIPAIDKEIFSWRFFADNPLRSWTGPESYSSVCTTYNRVRRQMVRKIKNPHSGKKRWTPEEIRYLKAEYPHIETMKVAIYLDRNYDSVRIKAQELRLKKTPFAKRKINSKCGKKRFCKPITKGEG